MDAVDRPSRWALVPPRRVVIPSLLIVGILVVPAGAVGLAFGTVYAVACLFGSITVIGAALVALDLRSAAALVAVVGAAAAAGAAAGGRPWAIVVLAVVAALAQAPLNQVTAAAAPLLPFLVVIDATITGDESQAMGLGLAAAGGAAAAMVVGRFLGAAGRPRQPIGRADAVRHAVALGVGCALVVPVALALSNNHGGWLMLTLCVVLVPQVDETRRLAVERSLGTAAGAVVAAVLVFLLGAPGAAVMALLMGLLTTAWTLVGDRFKAALFTTPSVILVEGVVRPDVTWATALERVGFTVSGALLAVTLSLLAFRPAVRSRSRDQSNAGLEGPP